MFDNLPIELRKLIFTFLKPRSYRCELCYIVSSLDNKNMFEYKGSESYIVCKRCWIGY